MRHEIATTSAARRTLQTPRPNRDTVREHIAAYVRSGALDDAVCEELAIRRFAQETAISLHTAEFYWIACTAPQGTFK